MLHKEERLFSYFIPEKVKMQWTFFLEAHELYVKQLLNPFANGDEPIVSPHFNAHMRNTAKKYLSWEIDSIVSALYCKYRKYSTFSTKNAKTGVIHIRFIEKVKENQWKL